MKKGNVLELRKGILEALNLEPSLAGINGQVYNMADDVVKNTVKTTKGSVGGSANEFVSIYKAPQKGKALKQFKDGFLPKDFPEALPGKVPAGFLDDGGKAFFAKEKSLADEFAKIYGEGVIEIRIPSNIYNEYFSILERTMLGSKKIELAIPHELFQQLNKFERLLHK